MEKGPGQLVSRAVFEVEARARVEIGRFKQAGENGHTMDRMDGGYIFHIATGTLKLTITPPDAKPAKKKAVAK